MSELGHGLNVGRHLIEFWNKIGQAYDLKTASHSIVRQAKDRVSAGQDTGNRTDYY